jgi:hypothetical protein
VLLGDRAWLGDGLTALMIVSLMGFYMRPGSVS